MTLMSFLSPLYALDFGTATTRIYGADSDTLSVYPTTTSRREKHQSGLPLVHRGRVTDSVRAAGFIRPRLTRQPGTLGLAKPRMAAAVSCCQTQVEKIALAETLSLAGASSVRLVSMAVAAACGAGVDLNSDRATVLLSCGQSSSELAVVLSGSQILSRELNLTMAALTASLSAGLERELNVLIQASTLGKLLAANSPLMEPKDFTLAGKDRVTGRLKDCVVPGNLINTLAREYLQSEVEKIEAGLKELSPTLAGDLVDQGMILYGGLAGMKGLALFLSGMLSLPVSCVPDPETTVIKGLKELVSSISFEEIEEDPMRIEVLGC